MVAVAEGDPERRSTSCCVRALAAFERFGVPFEIARTKALLARCCPTATRC